MKCSVISRKTAFEIDFLFSTTLKIYHYNASFDSLSSEFNDFNCFGEYYFLVTCFDGKISLNLQTTLILIKRDFSLMHNV